MKKTVILLSAFYFSIIAISQNLDDNSDVNNITNMNLPKESQPIAHRGNMNNLNIVSTIPSPISNIHDITFDGENLWVAGFNYDFIFKISMTTGEIIDEFPTNLLRPYGLTFDGQYIWVADAETDIIQQVDPVDGTILQTINSPTPFPSYTAGLAFDGNSIWQNDQRENMISGPNDLTSVISPDGTLINQFTALGDFPGGLAHDGIFLWSTDNALDEIHKIDPLTFSIIETFDAPGNIPLGLAFDGQYLWLADNGTNLLYQLDIGFLSTSDYDLESFKIYPNPASELINIQLQNSTSINIEIKLFDITGKLLQNAKFINNNLISINLSSFQKGIYIIQIKKDGVSHTQKIIKN